MAPARCQRSSLHAGRRHDSFRGMDEDSPIQTDAILDALRRAFADTDAPDTLLEVYARHAGQLLEKQLQLVVM